MPETKPASETTKIEGRKLLPQAGLPYVQVVSGNSAFGYHPQFVLEGDYTGTGMIVTCTNCGRPVVTTWLGSSEWTLHRSDSCPCVGAITSTKSPEPVRSYEGPSPMGEAV